MRAWIWWRAGKGDRLSRKREITFWILAPLTILILLTLLASQRQTGRPELKANVETINLGRYGDSTGQSLLMLTVRVKNIGTAPSIAERFTAVIKLTTGVVKQGERKTLPDRFVFTYPDGSSETISYGDQLDVRAQQPIPQGGQIFGRVFYIFDVDYDTMKNQLSEYSLAFVDAYDKPYSTTGKPSGWGGEPLAVPGIRPDYRPAASPSPSPSATR